MERLPLLTLCATIIAALTVIAATAADLPPDVAVHFGWRGTAERFASRESYVGLMSALVVLEPMVLLAALVVLPRIAPRLVNLPGRDYWMAPSRRAATMRRLARFAAALGCLSAVFLAAVHLLVVDANTLAPPVLPLRPFLAVAAGFLASMALWAALLRQRFRVTR